MLPPPTAVPLLTRALLAPLAAGLIAPLSLMGQQAARAEAAEQLTSIGQFSDVQPSDWAYQALSNLIERYGCVAGYPDGSERGGRAISRYEAAALLNACLERVSEVNDELKRLLQEFERELVILRGRVDAIEARVGVLEATRFSTTTKLSGLATFVVGANGFSGSSNQQVEDSRRQFGGTTFNYDLQLTLDTSFTGKDLLRANLRGGNFADSSFGGAGPTNLSLLETAFQEDLGAPDGGDVVAIERLFYQFPVGDFTFTLGGRVGQEDMLAIWPSVYPSDAVLDLLTLGGAMAAYNLNLGAGAGLWWQKNGLAISANYVAANGQSGTPASGGIASSGAGSSGSVQIGYSNEQWGLAAIYSRLQNANELIVYGTPFSLNSFSQPGNTDAFGLSGFWQPSQSGWLPSISAGWGINTSHYASSVDPEGLVRTSQSWSVGLQWDDVLIEGNALGMAVGQPTFATSLIGGDTPHDGGLVWEWWYQLQVSDRISVTPALFLLSRPLGGDTASGSSFRQVGGLIKTSFRF